MLVLSRRVEEEIVIAGQVRVRVVSVRGNRVRLGVVAPRSVSVDRAEVHERRLEFETAHSTDLENVLLPIIPQVA